MQELVEKDMTTTILNILSVFKELEEENRSKMQGKMKDFEKDPNITYRIKNTMSKMKIEH